MQMTEKHVEAVEMAQRGVRNTLEIFEEGHPARQALTKHAARLAEVAEYLRSQGWRTIDTLPKDPTPGEPVLATLQLNTGKWLRWLATARYGQFGLGNATHWLPLPAAPGE